MWFTYILLCRDGSYYIGSTNNVNKRLKAHFAGKGARYTKSHKPEKLIYQEKFSTKSEALRREAELKRWPKAKKEILISRKLETHPFGSFVPPHSKYLILGSFPGKPEKGNDWYYGAKRNQFWPILEEVYGIKLTTKKSKQQLFSKLKIAISDIIYQCERKKGTNLDNNLTNIVYNIPAIEKILKQNKIEKIFFSSHFVEKKFNKLFKNISIDLVTLPSPSPRYATMAKKEKAEKYRKLLPRLG